MSSLVYSTRKRGRPKTIREETDYGTPELQFKRAHGETEEALDLCLTKGIITPEQHWCGIHLRWLYTLRYGAPSVRAVDPNHIAGLELKVDDPEWRELREQEFHDAMALLHQYRRHEAVIDLCVHNERPIFLKPRQRISLASGIALEKLREGLDILVEHWQRRPRPHQPNLS